MSAKHTPWSVGENASTVYDARMDMVCMYADAEQAYAIVLCVNAHEELVKALQRIARAQADGLDGARDSIVLERAIKVAKQALSKVEAK